MEQYCMELTVKMLVPFYLEPKVSLSEKVENDVVDQIKETLEALEVEEIEIINKNVTKC